MAGDRKQLPPTSFFFGADAPEEDNEADDAALTAPDFESIIDVLLAVPLRPFLLSWHYRSKDERLIAFSNAHIYGSALATFPGVAGHECRSSRTEQQFAVQTANGLRAMTRNFR